MVYFILAVVVFIMNREIDKLNIRIQHLEREVILK